MHSFPARHRLARHSSVDWSSPDLNRFPKFANVTGSEGKWGERAQKAGFSHFYTLLLHAVILGPGDALFVPSSWIHEAVTLDSGVQCNMFGGKLSDTFLAELEECGYLKRL